MIRTLILLVFVTCVTAIFGFGEPKLWNEDLKVKFDPTKGFIKKPLTVEEAEKDDFIQVENPDKTSGFADLTHWIKRGDPCYLVSLYFDENNQIAGIQVNHPLDRIHSYFDLTKQGFKIWNHLDVDYAYVRALWVSEDKQTRIKSYNATKVLRNEYLTVSSFDGTTDKIATDSRKLDSAWCKEACIPWMGQHYYYKMTPTLTCDEPFHLWFPLTDEKTYQLIGVGLMFFGTSDCDCEKPSRGAVEMIVPTAPKCLYEMVDEHQVSTLHIYFIDSPRKILEC